LVGDQYALLLRLDLCVKIRCYPFTLALCVKLMERWQLLSLR
jgi:hypothetical protein